MQSLYPHKFLLLPPKRASLIRHKLPTLMMTIRLLRRGRQSPEADRRDRPDPLRVPAEIRLAACECTGLGSRAWRRSHRDGLVDLGVCRRWRGGDDASGRAEICGIAVGDCDGGRIRCPLGQLSGILGFAFSEPRCSCGLGRRVSLEDVEREGDDSFESRGERGKNVG